MHRQISNLYARRRFFLPLAFLSAVTAAGTPSCVDGSTETDAGETLTDIYQLYIAGNDAYATVGGVELNVTAAMGLLVNDLALNEVLDADTTSAEGGQVDVEEGGAFTYTPPAGFTGEDSFTYVAGRDDITATFDATVTIMVADGTPVASPGNVGLLEDETFDDGQLVATDPTGAALTYAVVTAAEFADDFSLDAATGEFSYTPQADYSGLDTFTFTATNADGAVSNTETVNITIAPINDQPTLSPLEDQTVLEGAVAYTITDFASFDAGAVDENVTQTPTYVIQSNDNEALFSVLPSIDEDGTLIYTPASQTFGTANITVAVQDDGGTANGGIDTSEPETFSITVDGLNAAPSFTPGADASAFEDSGAQTVSGWATDIDDGEQGTQTLTFILSDNTNIALFAEAPAVDPATGDLTFTPAADAFGFAEVTVVLMDDGGTDDGSVDQSAPHTLRIDILAVNDAPTFVAGGDQVYVGAAAPQILSWATMLATGPANESAQSLTAFEVVTNTNTGLFMAQPAIDPATGNLTYAPMPGAAGNANITVELVDDGGTDNGGVDRSAPVTFNIDLTVTLNAPTFTGGADQTHLEDDGSQTIAGWATAITDGTAFATTFVSDPTLFAGAPAVALDGTLTYTLADDANGSSDVSIVLNGSGGASIPHTLVITTTAVNDAPSFTSGGDVSFVGGPVAQMVPAWATDVIAGPANESGQALTFTVTANTNAALFAVAPAIDATTGTLTYTPAVAQSGTATLTIVLSDDGGTANGGVDASTPVTFDLTVTAQNQPPSFVGGPDQTVLEDAGAQTVPAWATAIDDGDGATQAVTFSVTNNTAPGLFSSGPAVAADGTLTYTFAPNANGSATVTIVLTDDGGTPNGGNDTSASFDVVLTATAVNDAPTYTPGADLTLSEDAGAQTVNGWAAPVTDGDEGTQTVTFTITSNDNAALFAVAPQIAANGTLTYTPAAGANGAAALTYSVVDDGGTANGGVDAAAPGAFSITISAVNDPPSFVVGADQNILEDAGPLFALGWATMISDGDDETQSLTFNVTGNTNPGLFSTAPTVAPNGTLSYIGAANANGTATITISLSDDGGGMNTSAPQTFDINVAAVNDPPSFTLGADPSANEDDGAQTVVGFASALSPGPADEAGQALAFSVTNNTNAALFSAGPALAANGTLTFTPAPNASGSATVTVVLTDDGGGANTSAAQTFDIDIAPVNDAPSFTAGADVTVNEDGGVSTVLGWAQDISDNDGDTQGLTFVVTANDNPTLFASGPTISGTTGALTFVSSADAFGVANVTVTLVDDAGGDDTSAPATFAINVDAVNDAPTFAVGADQTVANNGGPQIVLGWTTGSVGPANEAGQSLVSFNIVGNTNPGIFSIAPSVTTAGRLTYVPQVGSSGTSTITISLTDDGGTANGGADTSPTQTFTVTVN